MPDVRSHEPRIALDGGDDGLNVIRKIVERGPEFLVSGGWLMMELDPQTADPTLTLMEDRGFQALESRNDLSGQARIVVGRWPGED